MIRMLDTDTFILLLRGTALVHPRGAREKNVAAAAGKIRERCRRESGEGGRIGLSAISLAELEYGLRAGGRYEEKRPALQKALLPFENFAFDPVVCVHHYGRVRATLEAAGKTIGPLDLLIAAHALALEATLVTHNIRGFRRVPDLVVEDWARQFRATKAGKRVGRIRRTHPLHTLPPRISYNQRWSSKVFYFRYSHFRPEPPYGITFHSAFPTRVSIRHYLSVTPQRILSPLLSNWHSFVLLIGICLVVRIFGSATFKGRLGEWMVNRGLRNLDPSRHWHFHDLYLPRPDGKGTTQIDHVVVSPFGIFVIETKNYRGWIFGSERQREWTQQIYRRKSRFQNPLHQNHLHVRALMEFLTLPENRFHPVVFFIGNAEFKTQMPSNVLNRDLIRWIKNHQTTLLDPAALRLSLSRLDELKRDTHRGHAAKRHLADIKLRNKA